MQKNIFQMPQKIVVDDKSRSKSTLILSPLQPGFGHTIGNALRRTLISSVQGYAITKIKLPQGVKHEFDTIPKVVEGVEKIIINLKKIAFAAKTESPEETIKVKVKGKEILLAKDIFNNAPGYQVANPELVICHMDKDAEFEFELTVTYGRGYEPVEDQDQNLSIGEVPIDALYSPIKNVTYHIENVLIGNNTDYEQLTIELETDGSISAKEAIVEGAELLEKHFILFRSQKILSIEGLKKIEIKQQEADKVKRLLNQPIDFRGMSARAANALKGGGIMTLGDLARMRSIENLRRQRNVGELTVKEILKFMDSRGISFDMLSEYEENQ